VIGVANDRVKTLIQMFRMRRKSAKSLSAVLSAEETLGLSKVAVSFWVPGREVVMIHSYGMYGHGVSRNVVRTRAHTVSKPRKRIPHIEMKPLETITNPNYI
jgi:aspartate aminotransferase-like enzyme